MKKRLTKLLLAVLLLTVCVVGLSVAAQAAEPVKYGGLMVETDVAEACSYDAGNWILTFKKPGTYRVSMAADATPVKASLVVDAADVILQLDRVDITACDEEAALTLHYDTTIEAIGTSRLTGSDGASYELEPAISGLGKTMIFQGDRLLVIGGKGISGARVAAGIQASVEMRSGTLYAQGGVGSKMFGMDGKPGGCGITAQTQREPG